MAHRVLILGAGTAGTLVANRLRRLLPWARFDVAVVDRDDSHVYRPGLLLVPFGAARPGDLVRPRARQLLAGIHFRRAEVDAVDLDRREVRLAGGDRLPYDALVVASGTSLLPERTDGLTGPGWMDRVFTFYTLEGAAGLAGALARFDGGRLLVGAVDVPFSGPAAPLELCFLADAYLRRRGLRDDVGITYVTPLGAAFTRPATAAALGGLLAAKGVEVVPDFVTREVDGRGGRLVGHDGRTLGFDLAVLVPAHGGAAYVARSPGLGDPLGFVPADPHTLQSSARPEVFALGDAADLPAAKAGSAAYYQGAVVVDNVRRFLAGEPPTAAYDGHASWFVETGHGKAVLVDVNYDTGPLPGRYPGRLGLPLLAESRLTHAGRRAVGHLYWRGLLQGHDLPGVPLTMPRAGKRLAGAAH